MPYRRLPNTDQARLRALRAVLTTSAAQPGDSVVSYKSQLEAKTCFQNFEQTISYYQQMYDRQVTASKDLQEVFHNARLYLSHFIQVFNLSVIRGEIKPEMKRLFHISLDVASIPDFSSMDSLLENGAYVIEGEAERIRQGGTPLYNPAIAKVKVHYDIFKERRQNQLSLQQNTQRYAAQVSAMRNDVDTLIVDLWNQIEASFQSLPPYQRLETCKAWGVVYYYRRGEAVLTPENDCIAQPVGVEAIAEIAMPETVIAEPLQEHLLFDEEEAKEKEEIPMSVQMRSLMSKKKRNHPVSQDLLLSLFFQ